MGKANAWVLLATLLGTMDLSHAAAVTVSDGTYNIYSKLSNKVLDVEGSSSANNARIVEGTYSSSKKSQQWKVQHRGNGYYSVLNVNSGAALDVMAKSQENGAQIAQYEYNGGNNQLWEMREIEAGYVALIARHSWKALDRYSAGVQQYEYWGGDNQLWAMKLTASAVNRAGDVGSKPSSTVTLRTGTYDFGGRTIDGSGVGTGAPLFSCNKQPGVTIKNVKIVGNPRYGLFVRSCNSMTISGVTMNGIYLIGIRFDYNFPSKNLRIGSVRVENAGGHGVELWDVTLFSIDYVTTRKTSGCGLLLNRCKDGTVGTVDGDQNDQYGGYATMRFANGNGKVTVSRVKSRNSGRGVFSVTDSRDATVNTVDISGSHVEGIYLQDATNTKIKSGTVRGNPNCRIRGGSGNSIGADCGGSIQG